MDNLADRIANLSPKQLAQLTQRLKKKHHEAAAITLQPRDADSFPLSLAQQRLWFLHQLQPDSPFYNLPALIRIKGCLNVPVLEQSLTTLCERHEPLRTIFRLDATGEPVQVIQLAQPWSLKLIDLQTLAPDQQKKEIDQYAISTAKAPFELTQGPLLRTQLLQLAPNTYILCLCLHHIIADGWALGVFVQELRALYDAFYNNSPSPLPPLKIQYVDYGVWQRQALQGDKGERHLQYWQQQLQGVPTVLELPTDYPRPPIQSMNGARHSVHFDNSLTQALKALGQTEGATLFMVLLAAFKVLLYRYTQRTDLLVGTPVANRNQVATERLIGVLVNTLALRTQLQGGWSFRELLKQVRDVVIEANAHQDFPFEQLVEILHPERSRSYAPLLQVMLTVQNLPLETYTCGELTLQPEPIFTGTIQFDLVLDLMESADGLQGWLEYNTDIFSAATIERMVEHLKSILASSIATPDCAIAQMPLLTLPEQQWLATWNDTNVDYSQVPSIHQVFEAQVEKTPEAIAVTFGSEQLSYRELNSRANQLAHYLQRLGIETETMVGVYMDRSLDMIVGLLGILKAGGAYVPLDPGYPQSRLQFMLEDAQVPVLLTQARLLSKLPEHSARTVSVDQDWETIAQESQKNLCNQTTVVDQLAYVIYTSGTTGRPKGVCVTHRGVIRLVIDPGYVSICDRDIFLQLAPVSFDAATFEIWGALLNGAKLVLYPEPLPSLELLASILQQEAISILWLTAGLFHLVVEQQLTSLAPVKQLLAGGDVLSPQHVQQVLTTLPNCTVINGYGPTENTTFTCCHTILTSSLMASGANRSIPIGRPINNTQVYILDNSMQPMPIGIVGELYIGGAGLARGYLNRPELTAERFIDNPFGDGCLYKSGDLARYLANGTIEFLGRVDHQVKLRGFRIELGEVEAVLNGHEQVHQSVVMVREDSPGNKRLVGYVVGGTEMGAIKTYLQEQLPDYMVPSVLVPMEKLPLTPNGKLDRQALPVPSEEDISSEYVVPQTERQRLIASLMADVLSLPVERIGLNDNFFELGGNSLLTMQLASRLHQTFQTTVPLQALFEFPTISGVDTTLSESQSETQSLPIVVPIERDGNPIPLSYTQERLWFLDQLDGQSAAYNIPGAVQIEGLLDIETLQAAIDALVRRHEILRTTFTSLEGRAVQEIHPVMAIPLQVFESTELAESLSDWLHTRAQALFDLSTGPLLTVSVVRLSETTTSVLAVTMHHIISDGWSIGVFINELAALYNSYRQGESPQLLPLKLQYADYTLWQRQWLQGEALSTQLSYWQEQLSGAPALLSLPTDHPRPAVQRFAGKTHTVTLPLSLLAQLKVLGQRHQVTLFMTLLAGFQVLLYRYSRQRDVLVGTPIANRQQPELEGLIGCFVNTLVLRTQLDETDSVTQLLQQVRRTALGAYSHQDVPFEQVVETLQPQRTLSHSPLFQVMFVLQNMPMSPLELLDGTMSPLLMDGGAAQFDLTLSMHESEAGLMGRWTYNRDLFESATIERMAGHFETLLGAMVSDASQPVGTLPMLSPAEQTQLMKKWNDTAVEYPRHDSLHKLFEQQVARTPEATAVRFESESLSYAELNARSNQLARYLQGLGVGPETLVGICMERSLEMVVGLLGVLKAGGAYVPLDPSNPRARLQFMLDDTQVAVLLTQEHLLAVLPEQSAQVLCLDSQWSEVAQASDENLQVTVTKENLAYVIYTSGSTGQPKGVMNSHGGICNRLLWMQAEYGLTPDDRVVQKTPFSFDVSVWEFFWPLLVGAELVMARPEGHKDSGYLIELMVARAITTVHFVPSMLSAFLQDPEVSRVSSLKRVMCSGEALPMQLQQSFFAQLECELHNLYGPTEAAIDVTSWRCQQEPSGASVPIGRPIANTQIYILDEALQPVGVGISGELHIGGVGLARGYLGRSELTAERFITNPFGAGRLYKSGDLARYLSDGTIEYLGRIDHQVKLRGFRIELGEIESVLSHHEQVQQCVVMMREDMSGGQRLVAYVVSDDDDDVDRDILKAYLSEHLPDYMVPTVMVPLDVLPLTANGKVDRRALPIPDDELSRTGEFVAPETELQTLLATIWQNILGLDQVGIQDNFFELGGDSILSIQMIAQARNAGLSINPKQLFQYQTIGELSHAIAQGSETQILAQQGQVVGSVPLTPIQRWFLDQSWSNPHHFNQAVLLQVPPDIQIEGLHQSLAYLVKHHDALRLRFEHHDGQWHQFHTEDEGETLPLETVDLSTLPTAEQGTALEAIANQHQARLHLSHGPVWQIVLFSLGPQQPQRLLLILHHLVVDGVSWRILLGDLFTLYHQYLADHELQLPPKTTAFQDWALNLDAYTQSTELKAQLDYWLNLSWPLVKSLPVDTANPANRAIVADTKNITVSLTTDETEQLLKQVPKAYNTQINDVLLTALAEVLGDWSNSNTVLVNLEGHGRSALFEQVDVSRTVGWFTSLYPVVLTVAPNAFPGENLKAVKEQLRGIPQEGIGYGLLGYMTQDVEIKEKLRTLPTPELSFNYLGQVEQGLNVANNWSLAPETIGSFHSPEGRKPHMIDISAQVVAEGLQVIWSYSQAHHHPETINNFSQDYIRRLKVLIGHCLSEEAGGYTPSDFPLVDLTQGDLDEMLEQFDLS